MSLTEDKVKNAVVAHLTREGFKNVQIKTGDETGVDITAEFGSSHRKIFIEAKGDPSRKHKHPEQGRQGYFLQGLGQLLTRIREGKNFRVYGLAYPSSYRQIFFRRIDPYVLKVLKTNLYFVNEEGKVEQLNWSEFKRIREGERRKQDTQEVKAKAVMVKAGRKPTVLDAAERVLRKVGKPMNCQAIMKRILARGYWESGGKDPAGILSGAITHEIADKGSASRFKRLGKGLISLTSAR